MGMLVSILLEFTYSILSTPCEIVLLRNFSGERGIALWLARGDPFPDELTLFDSSKYYCKIERFLFLNLGICVSECFLYLDLIRGRSLSYVLSI